MWTTTPSDHAARAATLVGTLRLAAFVLSLLSLSAGAAYADEPPVASPDHAPPAARDPLDALRGRFREGMEKYRAGAFADAIVIWESIYRELGAETGYRVAFDLGRAYDELGELIKAAEHYQTYLDRVAARRRDVESLEPNVEKQEAVAHERIDRMMRIYGALHVRAARRPILVHVDNTPPRVAGFTVYVEPGAHTVTFGIGPTADVHRVTVRRGELLEIEPRDQATPAEARYETREERPFAATVLWASTGGAVVSLLLPTITYANALSIKRDFDAPGASRQEKERLLADYESARSNAYASIAVPALLTATTSGLALWYVLGRRETRTPLPTVSISATGGAAGLTSRF